MTSMQDRPPSPARRQRPRLLSRFGKRTRWAVPFAMGILAALLALEFYGAATPGPRPLTQQDVASAVAQQLASMTPAPPLAESAYQAVEPSLVLIQTQGATGTATPSSPSAPSSSPSASGAVTADGSLGSGVVVDSSGDILTALHVVAGAASIEVTFADGTRSTAQIQATQPLNDIAVLRASQPPAKLQPAVLGNPRSAQIGSEAFVVGNPFGLSGSISAGVISGLDRSFQLPNNGPLLQGLIQVDAAVNPGSSGGPLVNRDGQVIGIVSALINPTSQDVFIGIGLAVPIDVAGGAAGLPLD
jgi:S1-C subfamily serine protease